MAEFVPENIKIEEEIVEKQENQQENQQENEKNENQENQEKDKNVKEVKQQNICVVSISSHNPYDTSEITNNANTFYTNINYNQLKELYYIIRQEKETNNMVYKNIINYIKDRNTKVFFDFKCSSDCHAGENFVDKDTTLLIFKLVNVMTRKHCNIVVGDHSMAALFNNWDKHKMDFKSPIRIHTEHTEGQFKMYGDKKDFIESDYPILKNLGTVASDEKIDIEFSNMSGTKIYSINTESKVPVKIISKGKPQQGFRRNRNLELSTEEHIVHSEFKYRNGMIIVSATHWCNLTEVNSNVDFNRLRTQYQTQFGEEEAMNFEVEYQNAMRSGSATIQKRVISDSVKYMCSGKKG